MDVAYAIAICCVSTPKAYQCLECHCSYLYIYIDELALSLVVLLYASMIWMVHISSACQYIQTCSTCTLHMQWNSSRVHAIKTLWLQLTLIIGVGTWQGQLQLTRSPNIWVFPAYFTIICYATAHLCRYPVTIIVWLCFYNRMSNTQKELRLFIKLDRKQLWHNTLD